MVDGVVAHHLEVLGLVPRGRVGVGLVEGIGKLTPSIGLCLMPSTSFGLRDAADFEDGRHDVDDVMELVANAAASLMWPGQETHMPCRTPPKCEAICLVQLNGRVKGPGPADGHVVVGRSVPQTS